TEDLDLVGEVFRGLVERASLETGPILEVDEGESWAELVAELLERPPYRLVGGVVVHHLDDEVGVVDVSQCLERRPHHLHRLVVRRNLQRHPRQSSQRWANPELLPARSY